MLHFSQYLNQDTFVSYNNFEMEDETFNFRGVGPKKNRTRRRRRNAERERKEIYSEEENTFEEEIEELLKKGVESLQNIEEICRTGKARNLCFGCARITFLFLTLVVVIVLGIINIKLTPTKQ